ncbi:MAG: hypothetical protein HY553_06575 [Elusimicrobia bacterium]|nr:hypothetical protein [Elusimicrobiota bacterium]
MALAASARAAGPGWERIDAPAPGAPPSASTPPDETDFWERLQAKAFDDVCRHLDLKQGVGRSLGPGGVELDARRRLRRYPDGTLALIDQARLGVHTSLAPRLVSLEDGASLNVSFGASVEGESYIVRPLGEKKACKEVDTLLKLWEFKAALPFTPERIAAMKTGELWRIPLSIRLSVTPGVGVPITPETTLELHMGLADQGTVTATLYRLSQDELRFRLRLDRALIKDAGGSVNVAIPLSQLGIPEATDLLMKQATRLVWKELRRYAAATLAYSAQSVSQGRVLLELTVDPNRPEELAALRDALAGDLETIARWARRLALKRPGPALAREVGERLSERLGTPDFLGAEEREGTGRSFHIRLPLLYDGQYGSSRDKGTLYVLDGSGKEYESHRTEKRSESGSIDLPILGQYSRSTRQRVGEAVVSRDPQGSAGPMLIYSDQYGFRRGRGVDVRDFALQADRVLRLAGTRGRGENGSVGLPIDQLLPLDSMTEEPGPDDVGPTYKSYHAAVTAFTVVFNAEAVTQLLTAPVETILRAVAAAVGGSDGHMLGFALDRSEVRADGTLAFDRKKMRKALREAGLDGSPDPEAPYDPLSEIGRVAKLAASVAQDLLAAAAAPTPEARAEALARMIGGKGRSGLEYGDILEILVQLVDPGQLTAQLALRVEKKIKGEPDVAARFAFNPALAADPELTALAALRGRFAPPTNLTD